MTFVTNTTFHQLTGCQRDCIVVIAGHDSLNGLAIKEELDEDYGSEINHGRHYSKPDALVDDGFVDKAQIDDRTNRYSLTVKGREVIKRRYEWDNNYIIEE